MATARHGDRRSHLFSKQNDNNAFPEDHGFENCGDVQFSDILKEVFQQYENHNETDDFITSTKDTTNNLIDISDLISM